MDLIRQIEIQRLRWVRAADDGRARRRESGDLTSAKWSPAAKETPTGPLPREGTTSELDGEGSTAVERSSSDGAARVRATAATALGFRAWGEGGAAGQRRRLK
jgi:hypothetical protein